MPNLVRFDGYEVDLSAGQLYKHGIKISLRDKSFQVLVTLLETCALDMCSSPVATTV
jgi:DNA-binding response OmpR family regulator